MVHSEWKSYDSGEIESGDIVCLALQVGTVTHMVCPVCRVCLSKADEGKTCKNCGTKYDKRADGYLIHNIYQGSRRGFFIRREVD